MNPARLTVLIFSAWIRKKKTDKFTNRVGETQTLLLTRYNFARQFTLSFIPILIMQHKGDTYYRKVVKSN